MTKASFKKNEVVHEHAAKKCLQKNDLLSFLHVCHSHVRTVHSHMFEELLVSPSPKQAKVTAENCC